MGMPKIHCDLLEMFGPDWANITQDQVNCLTKTIHRTEELFGQDPDLFGFVGTQRLENIVGGFLALQYETDEFHYSKRKQLSIRHNAPFARILFVIFAAKGKVILQNTKFVGLPLNMHIAWERFRGALNEVLSTCGLPRAIGEFERSTRVVRLVVTDLAAGRIPPDFVYYNPQRERNPIIRDSHGHDYDQLKKVDLTAKASADLRETHLRDMIYASRPTYMVYYAGTEERHLRRKAPPKLEFYFDTVTPQVTEEQLVEVVERVRLERPMYIDIPTPMQPSPHQPTLFDLIADEEDE
jgi:hypothetical protein